MKSLIIAFIAFIALVKGNLALLTSAQDDQYKELELKCNGTSCASCTTIPDCGWCESAQKCIPGGITGATPPGTCSQQDWKKATCIYSNNQAANVVLYLFIALSIPSAILGVYCCWRRRKSQSKSDKMSMKTAFGVGMENLGNKYSKFLKGKSEGLLSPDQVFASDFSRDRAGGSKKGFSKLFG